MLFILTLFGLLQYFKNVTIATMADFNVLEYLRCFLDFDYGMSDGMTAVECTMFFTIFVFLQFWSLFNVKCFDSKDGVFSKLADSKVFFSSVLVIFVGQILIVQFGGKMFSVEALTITDWLYIVAGTSIVFWVGLIFNLIKRLIK